MNKDPIDYNSPLGISKREWTRVLGANLALLLLVYTVALICTMSGNTFFKLNFDSTGLNRIESTLRGWGMFALVQIAFSSIEMCVIATFVAGKRLRFWIPLAFFGVLTAADLICWGLVGKFPGAVQWVLTLLMLVGVTFVYNRHSKRELGFGFLRLGIGMVLSLAFNGIIALFRLGMARMFDKGLSNTVLFALNMEYLIALVLSLVFVYLVLPLTPKKGAEEPCLTQTDAGGSSPTTRNWSPKNSPTRNELNLTPKQKKRLRRLKAKLMVIQTVALLVVAFLPWVVGRPVEFSLVYASFCLTRFMLGFPHSLHFKSELVCVTVGAIVFWLLTYLTPSVEACLILSLAYGAGTALAFRLYWELHDLILYRRAAKLDRYAMFYCAFKGDPNSKHILGTMRAKGFSKEDIAMVTLYMDRVKVEAIGVDMHYSKRTVEDRLTDIANRLYAER